jgi:hypothetical protein
MPYKAKLVALAVAGLFLTACDSGVTVHEPGVYKGKKDETATKEAADRRAEPLRQRALTAMTDR